MKKNIIIIGARGFEYNYGGWETFVTNLVYNYDDETTQFYIPNLTFDAKENYKIYNKKNVISPQIHVKKNGTVTMFIFMIKAVNFFKEYIKKEKLDNVVLYILGCRVGPLFAVWKNDFHKMNVPIIINPDGLEWTRAKWSWWIKQCFKISERTMIKYSDYCVCDSKSIEEYVKNKYQKYQTPTKFIAYGAYLKRVNKINNEAKKIMDEHKIKEKNYYLIVGRFIPENNYETIIKEFMKSKTKKDLVIICNLEENKFYQRLKDETNFTKDKRIKFIGSVYNKDTLLSFRHFAYAYLHGHSAGGTNPSLLEALSQTNLNILFDVSYNKEVGLDSCFYFTKEEDNLKKIINKVDKFSEKEQKEYGKKALARIKDEYTWNIVVDKYKELFNKEVKIKK